MPRGVGVVGTGKHGARYLRHLAETPGLRLTAICRRDPAAGRAQASELGCRFHADPEGLIADPEVDAVVLVAPPSVNVQVATSAARAGKALLIEKPLATTVAGCRAIAEAVAASGVFAMVAHTLRFNAVVTALARALPGIGPLHAAVITQRFEPSSLRWLDRKAEAGGGIILHTGVHSFDLLRFLTGAEPRRLTAQTRQVVTRETEDNFAAIVEMEDGILGMVGGSRATAGRSGAIELAGRDGQLIGDHVTGTAATLVGTTSTPLPVRTPVLTVPATLRAFATALDSGDPPPITLADGAAAVALAEACYRSFESGRAETVERL